MPRWKPKAEWVGQEVFIIGGGSSLRGFDWPLLHNELTIGCNNAYALGEQICKICLFGDNKWFKHHEDRLSKFKNPVFTCSPQMLHTDISWVWSIPREVRGLHKECLGWNGNTGASAVNLALILGAKIVYLLGFDMHLSKEGDPNWHDETIDKPNSVFYQRFVSHFKKVATDLPVKFPGKEIININVNSKLTLFPAIDPKVFWGERKAQC